MNLNPNWIGEVFSVKDNDSKDTIAVLGLDYRKSIYVTKRYKNGCIGGTEASLIEYKPQELDELIDHENHIHSSSIPVYLDKTYIQEGESEYDTIEIKDIDFHRKVLFCKHTHDGLCGGELFFFKEIPFSSLSELKER